MAADAPVWLEPLGRKHASDFARLACHDAQLTELARLPVLRDGGEVEAWIRDRARSARREPFAIVHPEHGFVGAISLAAAHPLRERRPA